MRAIVLAGGHGARLRPLSDVRPKPLLPIANEPLVARWLRGLAAAGVSEIRGAPSAALPRSSITIRRIRSWSAPVTCSAISTRTTCSPFIARAARRRASPSLGSRIRADTGSSRSQGRVNYALPGEAGAR